MGRRGAAEPRAPKEKAQKMQRPQGMSREAFALLGDSHPIISSQLMSVGKKADVKAKPKPSTKGIPTWQFRPFKSSARSDGLELKRWIKSFKDLNGRVRNDDDGDYYYAKFNKRIQMYRYTDDEYERLLAGDSAGWTKEESDYLMDLCDRFDLKFVVVQDRYEFPGASRSVEDLKERYYAIARRLLASREGGESAVANHTLMRFPFNKEHEAERKAAVHQLLTRTSEQIDEENAILAEYKVIEDRRKMDAAADARRNAAAAAAASAAAAAAKAAAVAAGGGGGGGGIGMAFQPAGVDVAALESAFNAEDLRHAVSFTNEVEPGTPSLFDASLNPAKPPAPGVYFRSACTAATIAGVTATISGGPRVTKAVEQTLGDLGYTSFSAPRYNSRAVCASWIALRSEIIALHEGRGRQGAGRPMPGSSEGADKAGSKRGAARPRR
ncbi:hypothetical protein FOA52_011638 [Chlamydomonas sp. UWO 241]|nr:hypothetical protein FOA52_011638 [Chlamydomonas sp. UWO 241]